MTIIYILIGILLFYLIFIVGPSVTGARKIFARKEFQDPDQLDEGKSYYKPYLDQMHRAAHFLQSQPNQVVHMTSRDGLTLAADYFDGGHETLAICLHGYWATPMTNFCVLGDMLYQNGCSLLFVHQRAHGKSQGSFGTLGILESGDLLEWVEWARQHTPARKILLCGVSMGSFCVALASDKLLPSQVQGMILDCGYCSPRDQLAGDCRKWHLPSALLVPLVGFWAKRWYHIDMRTSSCDSLAKTRIPALFLHGAADQSVPPSHCDRCFDACGSDKEKLIVEGADHTVSLLAGGEQTREFVLGFLKKHELI